MRSYLTASLLLLTCCAGVLRAQTLTLVSGNGQVVQSQFLSNLLIVEAKDATGKPAAGVSVSWKITQGSGTLVRPTTTTDANGQASVTFLATDVPVGESFFPSTVTATSGASNVNFLITTTLTRLINGNSAAPPLVRLVTPPQNKLSITGPSGTTLAGGVVVQVVVQAGPQTGVPVPNVSVQILNNQDPSSAPPAACNGPNGVVLTDSNGLGTCDLVITGAAGNYQLTAWVGQYQDTTPFTLTITPGVSCSFALSSSSATFPASGGSGTVNIITTSGCGWTAASNAAFLTITSGASGTGNGVVGFSVAANTGAARSGTLSIAGQTFTVNQSAGTPGSLAITTPPNLSPGNVGSTYSVQLTATGGTPPYTWSISGNLPPGLVLDATHGVISGTPSTAGTYPFTLTVTDNSGTTQSQNSSITINSVSSSGFGITNVSFPSGVLGQPYQQLLTTSGGCVSPFSPSPAFQVTAGALPGGLTIQTNSDFTRSIVGTPNATGVFNFTLTATDACAHTVSAAFTITITSSAGPAQMNVSPTSLAFTLLSGGGNIPADQTITLTSTTTTVLNFSATASTNSGGNWLTIRNSAAGSTPGSLIVGLSNFSSLKPGPYVGSIKILSQASNSPVVVPVTLTVLNAPTLTVNPQAFTVTQVGSTGQTTTRQSIVVNSSPQVNFTASAATQTGGSWLTVDPMQGFTPGSVTAIINAGGLAVGSYTGTVTVTPVGGTAQVVTITLDILAPAAIVAAPAPVLFDYQKGGAAPAAATLSLSSTGEALNLTVGTSTESGGDWLSVTPKTVTTPATVTVSVKTSGLDPGTYHGSVTLAATDPSVFPLAVPVTLTVSEPLPSIGAITNAASFAPGPVSPGEFVTIFGSLLGPATPAGLELTSDGKVSTNLAGTQVFFDDIAAPMLYSSAGQISAIVPYEVAGKTTTELKVAFQGVMSAPQLIRVIGSAPGVFVADSTGQGAFINHDGTPNSSKNGAAPGSVVSIYVTGEGVTDPPSDDGVINATSLPLPKPHLLVTVQINGEAAPIKYYGAAPGEVAGIMQVNVQVPSDAPPGKAVAVTVTVGLATSQPGVTLFIRP